MSFRLLNILAICALFWAASCAHQEEHRPIRYYQPDFYRGDEDDSSFSACYDAIFEGTPPRCADVGWCATRGHYFDFQGEGCKE